MVKKTKPDPAAPIGPVRVVRDCVRDGNQRAIQSMRVPAFQKGLASGGTLRPYGT
jgi:hypothetical protein